MNNDFNLSHRSTWATFYNTLVEYFNAKALAEPATEFDDWVRSWDNHVFIDQYNGCHYVNSPVFDTYALAIDIACPLPESRLDLETPDKRYVNYIYCI